MSGEISILATSIMVEFSMSPIAATKPAATSRNNQSKVRVASALTSFRTCARFVRARTDDENLDHAELVSLL